MILELNGYRAAISYDPDIEKMMGTVIGSRDVITFYGASVADLKREFQTSLDDYLAICRERGIEPEKPFSGKFNVRIAPALHADLVAAAAKADCSLNAFVEAALARGARETLES